MKAVLLEYLSIILDDLLSVVSRTVQLKNSYLAQQLYFQIDSNFTWLKLQSFLNLNNSVSMVASFPEQTSYLIKIIKFGWKNIVALDVGDYSGSF